MRLYSLRSKKYKRSIRPFFCHNDDEAIVYANEFFCAVRIEDSMNLLLVGNFDEKKGKLSSTRPKLVKSYTDVESIYDERHPEGEGVEING